MWIYITEALSIPLNNNVKISNTRRNRDFKKAFKAISPQKEQPPLSPSILHAFIFYQKNSVDVKT